MKMKFGMLCAVAFAALALVSGAKPVIRTGLPREAFTTPTNHVLVANVGGAVDAKWLGEFCKTLQMSLQVGVKTEVVEASPEELACPRKLAKRLMKADDKTRMVVLLEEGEDLPPILASPYEFWSLMDAGWVKRGTDASKLEDRMGKRIYQAIGACVGAGNRAERQAVVRRSPTPESLDLCLSHNFHPFNQMAFFEAVEASGLDRITLRPEEDLIAEGIITEE